MIHLILVIVMVTPNSIAVDGILHRNQMRSYYRYSYVKGDLEAEDTGHLDIDSVFLQWDTVRIYIRVKTADTFFLGNNGDLFVAIDTFSAQGGSYSPLEKAVRFSTPYPDFVLYINDNTDDELFKWDSGWRFVYRDTICAGAGTNPDYELSIPIDSIGRPDSIKITVYTTRHRKGDSVPDYSVGDTVYSNIVLDGQLDGDYVYKGYADQGGGAGAQLDSLYTTWDSDYFYIFIKTANTASWDVAYGVGIDSDEQPSSGYYSGDSDAWGRKMNFANTLAKEAYAIDMEAYFWWSGADGAVTSAYLYRWNGNAWEDSTPGVPWYYSTGDTTSGLSTLEIKIPWTTLGGVHPELHISTWITGGDASSAVSVIPHDDQVSNSAGEWSDSDTLYTYSVTVPDGDRVVDVSSNIDKEAGPVPDTVSLDTFPIVISEHGITFGYYDYSNWGASPMGFLDPMDGIVDTCGFDDDEMLFTMSSKNAWLTFDNDSVYIGYTYQAFDSGYGGEGDFFVYFDVDSASSANDVNDPGTRLAMNWWGSDSIILPLKMDYAIGVEDGNYYALYKFNADSGYFVKLYSNLDNNFPGSAYIGWDNAKAGNGVTEISVSRAALSTPDWFSVVVFSHTEDASALFGVSPPADSAYFQDPAQNLNNNDAANDTLKEFWGFYHFTGSNSILVNAYLSVFPQSIPIKEREEKSAFRMLWSVNGISFPDIKSRVTYSIFDAQGRFVKNGILTKQNHNITFNGLSNGIYFVNIKGRKKIFKILKIK